jgi:hypothetical protein
MSQLSSQAQDPNWVSAPIIKFSHNTSPYGSKTFVWDHINHRNDLDLVIRTARAVDDYGSYQDRILMKITGGAEVLVWKYPRAVEIPFDPRSGNSRSRPAGPPMPRIRSCHWHRLSSRRRCEEPVHGHEIP